MEIETPAELETWFDTPSLDLEQDARVALRDGRIVGYGDVGDASGKGNFLWFDIRVDPACPEAWEELLDFAEARGRERGAEGAVFKAWSPEGADEWRSLLESRGYAFHHYSLRMLAPLDREPEAPEWPDGLSLRAFERDGDERAVYEVQQETFADQRDFEREPFEDWRHWSLREPFDPELWFLAEDGGELAGIALCRPEWDGDPAFGWVSVLGVRRPWRRQGLGLALLLHAFRELRARGKTRVGLGVDAENPTGAVRLYERAGMAVERRLVWYEKPAG